MPPLMMLAGTLLPEILKLFATDKTGTVEGQVNDVFQKILNTDNKEEAEKKLSASASDRTAVEVQLAQIAANEAAARHEAEQAERQFELEALQDQYAEAERRREAEFRRYQLDATDRNQARERQSRLEDKDSIFAYVAPTLAIMVTLGLGYFLYLLLTTHNELQNKDVFNTILGALTTAFVTIITYYFGSSIGSKEKDQLISSGQLVPAGGNANQPDPNAPQPQQPPGDDGQAKPKPGPAPDKKSLPPPTGPFGLFRQKAPKIVGQLMRDFSLTDFQAAGILGNLGHECAGFRKLQEVKPLIAGSKGGWGWAQWTGDRRRLFEEWASSHGFGFSSDEANYGYLRVELNGAEGRGVLGPLRQTKDLSSATRVFMDRFERPNARYAGLSSREHFAEIALTEYRRA